MTEDIKMDKVHFKLQDLLTLLGAATAVAIEEFMKHPIGVIVSLILLLLTYERWRTQRVTYKIKLQELKNFGRKSADEVFSTLKNRLGIILK